MNDHSGNATRVQSFVRHVTRHLPYGPAREYRELLHRQDTLPNVDLPRPISATKTRAPIRQQHGSQRLSGPAVCVRMLMDAVSIQKPETRKEPTMPTYSYRCQACRKSFSVQMTIAEHDKVRAKCPKCGSRKLQQKFGSVGVITSKKS